MNERTARIGAPTLLWGLLLGTAAGLVLAAVRLLGYANGHRLVFFPVLRESVNQALIATVALLFLWVVVHALLRGRALLATSLLWLPAAAALLWWLNDGRLPPPLSAKGLAANAGIVVGFLVLLPIASALLARWRGGLGRASLSRPMVGAAIALPLLANVVGLVDRGRFEGPRVIVILIDVLRADRLGCYGYERDTSPNLDRFAEDAVLFEQCVAQSSFTKTSVASLFSGLYPFRHRVYAGGIHHDVLGSQLTTIAETLAYEDFLTVAWVENPQLRAYMGFDQGFARYHDQPGHVDVIADEFLYWVDEWGRRNKFFAYLHVLDLHGPYIVEPPFDTMFGRHSDRFDGMTWPTWREYKASVTEDGYVPPADELAQLNALYDGQIAYIDQELGRIFQALKDDGLYDESLIVVTADHGEGFMEHGFLAHTNTPYEELIRVPLIVKLPHSEGGNRRVADQVALVDLAPTLEEHVRLGIEVERDGKSLVPLLTGSGPLERQYVFSELSDRMAVRTSSWKFIHLRPGRPNELYDLAADPGEQRNVIEEHPDVAARLEDVAEAAEEVKQSGEAERVSADAADVERLRALGYL